MLLQYRRIIWDDIIISGRFHAIWKEEDDEERVKERMGILGGKYFGAVLAVRL